MRLIDADALMAEMHNVILEDGEDRRIFYEVIERQPTIEPERKTERMVKILADVLDGSPLTQPCDCLWEPEGWCKEHCKAGQGEPDAECWLKYAEVKADE